jgi:hypothetical protein
MKLAAAKNLKDGKPDKIKDDLKYIEIGCLLASNSELAPE